MSERVSRRDAGRAALIAALGAGVASHLPSQAQAAHANNEVGEQEPSATIPNSTTADALEPLADPLQVEFNIGRLQRSLERLERLLVEAEEHDGSARRSKRDWEARVRALEARIEREAVTEPMIRSNELGQRSRVSQLIGAGLEKVLQATEERAYSRRLDSALGKARLSWARHSGWFSAPMMRLNENVKEYDLARLDEHRAEGAEKAGRAEKYSLADEIKDLESVASRTREELSAQRVATDELPAQIAAVEQSGELSRREIAAELEAVRGHLDALDELGGSENHNIKAERKRASAQIELTISRSLLSSVADGTEGVFGISADFPSLELTATSAAAAHRRTIYLAELLAHRIQRESPTCLAFSLARLLGPSDYRALLSGERRTVRLLRPGAGQSFDTARLVEFRLQYSTQGASLAPAIRVIPPRQRFKFQSESPGLWITPAAQHQFHTECWGSDQGRWANLDPFSGPWSFQLDLEGHGEARFSDLIAVLDLRV